MGAVACVCVPPNQQLWEIEKLKGHVMALKTEIENAARELKQSVAERDRLAGEKERLEGLLAQQEGCKAVSPHPPSLCLPHIEPIALHPD